MISIITNVFTWIGSIINTIKRIIIIDNWSLLDFYVYPFLFSIIITFLIIVIKSTRKKKKNEKSE